MKHKRYKRKYEGISFKKSFFLLIILLLQLIAMIVLYVLLVDSLTWVYTTSIIISILTSLRVLVKTKNPDAKASWIFFILAFPTFGWLLYFLAGGSDLHPIHRKRLEKINYEIDPLINFPNIDNLDIPTKEKTTYLQKTTNSTAYQNTETKYYPSGELIMEDIKKDLRKATKFIYLEFFIINHGKLLNELLDILVERANTGVEVRIIYDGFGSADFMNKTLRNIFKNNNIKASPFSPVSPIFSFYLNYRDHRKRFIIDNKITYMGGFNLADEYVNYNERFGYWKDNGLKFMGDAVNHQTINFLKMWNYTSKEKVNINKYLNIEYEPLTANKPLVIPYETGPIQDDSPARSFYYNFISQAVASINIMTPYLTIDDALINLLSNKATGGVVVNILIPAIPDKRIVYSLTKHTARQLIRAGCNVYTYTPGFLHAKTMLIDDREAIVGSINFDFRSFYHQYENAIFVNDPNTVKDVKKDFKASIELSDLLPAENQNRFKRIYGLYLSVLKWIAPLM